MIPLINYIVKTGEKIQSDPVKDGDYIKITETIDYYLDAQAVADLIQEQKNYRDNLKSQGLEVLAKSYQDNIDKLSAIKL